MTEYVTNSQQYQVLSGLKTGFSPKSITDHVRGKVMLSQVFVHSGTGVWGGERDILSRDGGQAISVQPLPRARSGGA